jgi:polyisoprenoid-binding protein YceI
MSMKHIGSALIAAFLFATPALAGDTYKLDPGHTFVGFQASHFGIGKVYGRFNTVSGSLVYDANDVSKSSITFEVETASIDTALPKRDDHLRGPDFFNAKQFPKLTFKSTKVGGTKDSLKVTGDLTMHGVTKSVTVDVKLVGAGKDPWGNERVGFETMLKVKRSDFGMKYQLEAFGDETPIYVTLEGIKQK